MPFDSAQSAQLVLSNAQRQPRGDDASQASHSHTLGGRAAGTRADSFPSSQIKDETHDLDANLALLRFYQYNPSIAQVEVARKVAPPLPRPPNPLPSSTPPVSRNMTRRALISVAMPEPRHRKAVGTRLETMGWFSPPPTLLFFQVGGGAVHREPGCCHSWERRRGLQGLSRRALEDEERGRQRDGRWKLDPADCAFAGTGWESIDRCKDAAVTVTTCVLNLPSI